LVGEYTYRPNEVPFDPLGTREGFRRRIEMIVLQPPESEDAKRRLVRIIVLVDSPLRPRQSADMSSNETLDRIGLGNVECGVELEKRTSVDAPW
jgi:hypothetical protein